MKTMNSDHATAMTAMSSEETDPTSCPCWATPRSGTMARQDRHDAGEDDQRDAVADAARCDLLAEPHQEHGAAGQGHDRRDE